MSWNTFIFKKIIGPDLTELPEHINRLEKPNDCYIYEEDPGKGGLPNFDWLSKHICSVAPNSVFLGVLYSYSSKSLDNCYANIIFNKEGWWMFNAIRPMSGVEIFCDNDQIIRGEEYEDQKFFFSQPDLDLWNSTEKINGIPKYF